MRISFTWIVVATLLGAGGFQPARLTEGSVPMAVPPLRGQCQVAFEIGVDSAGSVTGVRCLCGSELSRILRKHSRALAEEVAAQLTSRSISRYREVDHQVLSVRCRLLAEALIRSVDQGREQFGEFVAPLAGGRLAEGFELEDLQTALRILETRAWLVVANESTPDSLRGNLTALNTMIGYARAELARVSRSYERAIASSTPRPRLDVNELFRGTESTPLGETHRTDQ